MKLKKALSLTLALVMSLTLAIPAFAVEGDGETTDPDTSVTDPAETPDLEPEPEKPDSSDFVIKNGVLTKYTGDGGSVVIPDGVTSIQSRAFADSGLTSVTIPDSVTSIGNDAFFSCDKLTNVTISGNVTSMGSSVFSRCKNLTSVTILGNVTSIGGHAFSECESLRNVIIPDSVTSIGDHAFFNCKSLTRVTIPNSVTSIGNLAFYGTGLTSVVIPDSVTQLGDVNGPLSEYGGVFANCPDLTSATLPSGITAIPNWMFANCPDLTSVNIPDNVRTIGTSAFAGCTSLRSVTIPDGVTTIESYAFNGSALTSITIPDSVTKLGGYAFSECKNLTDVELGKGLKQIEPGTFNKCSSLTALNIPDGVTSIGQHAFQKVSKCQNLTIPGSVTSIDNLAFGYGCVIPNITYGGTKAQWAELSKAIAPRYFPLTVVHCTDGDIMGDGTEPGAGTITVSFNSNGGSSVSSKTVTVGERYGSLSTPTREGYVFDGWYTSKTGGSKVTSSTTVSNESNHTLYAHWTSQENMMTVSPSKVDFGRLKVGYDQPAAKTVTLKNIGEVSIFPTVQNSDKYFEVSHLGGAQLKPGESVTITIRPKAGLEVGDYETTIPVRTVGAYALRMEIPVTVIVENENPVITVAFVYSGGTNPSSVFNKSVTVGQPYGELPTSTREGYTFDGWYTTNSGSGGSKVTSSTIVPNTTHHILYARWTEMQPQQPVEPEQPVRVPLTAAPTNDALTLNGVKQSPTVFKLDGGDNYFKIRDLAAMLNGTEKQFAVDYDGAVQVTTGKAYTPVGGELAGAAEGNFIADPTTDAIYINGVKADLTAYKIEGNNFFRLRDLGKALDFYVGWTAERGVFIETDKPYAD